MREPSLKWTFIAFIIAISVFLLSFNAYGDLVSHNGGAISNNYTLKYDNITKYQGQYESWGGNLDAASILAIPGKFLSTFLTAVSLGSGVLTTMFTALIGVKGILNTILLDPDFAEFRIIGALLITIFTIYIAYRLVSEVRGVAQS